MTALGLALPGSSMLKKDLSRPPITAITPSMQGLARETISVFNSSEHEGLRYGWTSNEGRTVTLTIPGDSGQSEILRLTSSKTQRDPNTGKLEPRPADVTSLSVTEFTDSSVNTAAFTRQQDGSWQIINTYPNPATDGQQKLVTELRDGVPVTSTINGEMGRADKTVASVSGDVFAAQNIVAAKQLFQLAAGAAAQAVENPPLPTQKVAA